MTARKVKVEPFHFGAPEWETFGARKLRRVEVYHRDKSIGFLWEGMIYSDRSTGPLATVWSPCSRLMQHHGVPQSVCWQSLQQARSGVATYLKAALKPGDDK